MTSDAYMYMSNVDLDEYINHWECCKKMEEQISEVRTKYADMQDKTMSYRYAIDEETNLKRKIKLKRKISLLEKKEYKIEKQMDLLLFEDDIHSFYKVEFDHFFENLKTKSKDVYQNYFHKTKYISKSKIKQLENEECCICLETHKAHDLTTTCCDHTFGKSCFNTLVLKQQEKLYNENEDDDEYEEYTTSCPLCRKNYLQFTFYKQQNKIKQNKK